MKLFEWYLNVMHGWHFDKALSNDRDSGDLGDWLLFGGDFQLNYFNI